MRNAHLPAEIMTAYLDGESTPQETAVIVEHLRTCARCRAEVEAESTGRQVLRWHAAIARTRGEIQPWRPRAYRLGHPTVTLRTSGAVGAIMLLAVLATFFALRSKTVEAVGFIGDSSCVEHPHASDDPEAHACTLNCVKKGAQFVLVSGTTVYRIKNQQFPNLGALANVPVTATGTVTADVITLKRVVPARH